MAMPKVIAIVKFSSFISNFLYLFNIAAIFKNLLKT